MIKKFYCGAVHIARAIEAGDNSTITRETVEEAIEDAKEKIRRGEVNSVVVVEIVRIVRKDYPPITVDEV